MGGSALYLVAVFAFYFPAVSHSQLYSLITPNVLRVESEETVVVEAHGLSAPIVVTVNVLDFPLKKNILYQVQTNLNPANGMMGTAVIKVPTKDIKKDSKRNQYVVVKAKFPQQTLEKVVLVHFHSGYIFIQTDKTIYTPGSRVLCRIFTVGHRLEPVSKRVIVEYETPESIIVKQISISAPLISGIVSLNYSLPEIVSLGTWKIMARYEDSPQQTFSAQFDVKEYVLPSFEVILEPSEKFLYIDSNEDFRVSITARYLYGKTLDGYAFVLFGVKMDDEKRSIPQSLRRISIEDGDGEATLTRAMLQARFVNLNELVGHSLYVSVIVLTESGSDMVEVEKTGINIVISAYQIHFTKTPKYFKPGMPFELMVYVTNPDGSPAPRVPVQAEGFHSAGLTQGDGTAKLIINMPGDRPQVPITVKTAHPNLPANRQASKSMVAEAYQSQGGSRNYLRLAVMASELKPGDNLLVNFHLTCNNPAFLNQIQYFTYIILNKGKIIRVGRQARQVGQNLVIMSLPITPDLIPSFRIVAYYQVGNSEIVADSVWLDIQDTCMGTLVVNGATERDRRIHEPGTPMKLKLEGDHRAYVGLVAVDKGVYILNKNHKITQSKIWDAVEKSDIGCTAGSGKNNLGVFTDAGLALETSSRISTPQRTDPECPQPAKRRRRSVQLIEYKGNKAADYQDRKLKKCCEDGMHENPMGHSCEKRVGYILGTAECKKTFLDCCNYIKTIRDKLQRELHLKLARSDLDEDFMSEEDITSRSQFPESWLWQVEQLTERPNELGISSKTVPFFLKDSITTWEVLAVSLSETKGICVADPYEIKVMKDFFIDLHLPYSVVRNEQVQIRAILYNYREQTIKVRVELLHNPVFCSASTSKAKYRQILDIKAKSSLAVPLVIVPLQLGCHYIEVKAAIWGSFVSDGVRKKLKVVPEGMRMTKTIMSVVLDPSVKGAGGVQEVKVKAADIDDMVPDTESETKVSIQGNPVTIIVENSIDGANLKHLIVTPSGSGEENMIGMTPPVIATIYLDSTEQWERIGVERRAEAIKLIMQGYTQQMVYKKPDFSYAAFKDRPSSTWLTAYVTKVFAMAKKLVPIENQVICGAVKWLTLEKQKLDGVFQEDAPVIHGEMVGGYKGAEPDVSLTAFVLIALEEAKDICKDQVNVSISAP
ncbi:complement C3-like isoform X1 [Mauremys mutica]|uniref:complement C3-like isoform X1 n=1 Tax=Mauremys mutica TaxID=74926 RepID=UPI001D15EEE5|nr:complement C3-like isoform X1 [Mauremys mutica]